MITLSQPTLGGVIYVDDSAPAGGDGSSWDTAYRFLKDAISFASIPVNGVTEIRIGQGVYWPDRSSATPNGSGSRAATFSLIDGVAIRGGYAGTGAADPDLRDIVLFPSRLSGDLLNNDTPGGTPGSDPHMAENSLHVVTATGTNATAILDGCIVSGGYASGPATPDKFGGGVYVNGGSPTLSHCTVSACVASYSGGGLWHAGSGTITLDTCSFTGNYAGGGRDAGGAGAASSGGGLAITACTFEKGLTPKGAGAGLLAANTGVTCLNTSFTLNNAKEVGAAASITGGSFSFTGCSVTGNSYVNDPFSGAGGVAITSSLGTLTECVFQNNSGHLGGGLFLNTTGTTVSLQGCSFIGNTASFLGGGIYSGTSSPTLTDCTFTGNSGGERGGGFYGEGPSSGQNKPVFTNCTFTSNAATLPDLGKGGGYGENDGSATFNGCLFDSNTAALTGGAMDIRGSGVATLNGTQFVDNDAPAGKGVYCHHTLRGSFSILGADELLEIGPLTPGIPPAAPIGTLVIDGSMKIGESESQADGVPSVLTMELAGPGPGQFDRIDASQGSVELGGSLALSLLGGYVPAQGSVFPIITSGVTSGFFRIAKTPALPAPLALKVEARADGVSVLTQPVPFQLSYGPAIQVLALSGTIGAATSLDFDLDGSPDLALVVLNKLVILHNLGNDPAGNWNGFAQVGAPVPLGSGQAQIVSGFFNGDALPDLAVINQTSSNLWIALNAGGTNPFPSAVATPVSGGPTALAVGHVDAGPTWDLAIATANEGLKVLSGSGSGSFGPATPLSVGGTPRGLAFGDFNGDGINDLVVSVDSSLGGLLNLLLGAPGGGFTVFQSPEYSLQTTFTTGAVSVGDLNGDGAPDVLVVTGQLVEILMNLNDGTGHLAQVQTLTLPAVTANPVAIDADRDGDLDVMVLTGSAAPGVRLLRNDRDCGSVATFAPPVALATTPSPTGFVTADVNSDGVPDLVTINSNGTVSVRLGLRTATVYGDLNNDGAVDGLDLGILLGSWSVPFGAPGCGGATPCPADLNGDGTVDGADLCLLLGHWGG